MPEWYAMITMIPCTQSESVLTKQPGGLPRHAVLHMTDVHAGVVDFVALMMTALLQECEQ